MNYTPVSHLGAESKRNCKSRKLLIFEIETVVVGGITGFYLRQPTVKSFQY